MNQLTFAADTFEPNGKPTRREDPTDRNVRAAEVENLVLLVGSSAAEVIGGRHER